MVPAASSQETRYGLPWHAIGTVSDAVRPPCSVQCRSGARLWPIRLVDYLGSFARSRGLGGQACGAGRSCTDKRRRSTLFGNRVTDPGGGFGYAWA